MYIVQNLFHREKHHRNRVLLHYSVSIAAAAVHIPLSSVVVVVVVVVAAAVDTDEN
jgi:hypothetical protein